MLVLNDNVLARFWARVDKTPGHGPNGKCWPWTGGKDWDGYGQIKIAGKTRRAHRLAWEIANGPILDGLHVLHHCDNPPCCNDACLFLGTNADNMADMAAKGRGCIGDRNGSRLHPERLRPQPGEENAMAKLTDVLVVALLADLASGMTGRATAKKYDVSTATVSLIRNGLHWKHITA